MAVIGHIGGGFTPFVTSGGSGAAASSFNPVGLVLNVALIAHSMMQKTPKDRRSPGYGVEIRDNPTDPTLPIPAWYGKPVEVPPVLFRYFKQATNSLQPVRDRTLVTGLSLGSGGEGGLDGRDLTIWKDDVKIVQGFSPSLDDAVKVTLTPVDGSNRKRWKFPQKNVVRETVVIFFDGVAHSVFDGLNGGFVFESVLDQVTDQRADMRRFRANAGIGSLFEVDRDIPGSLTRLGAYQPTVGVSPGWPGTLSVKYVAPTRRIGRRTYGGEILTLAPDNIKSGTTDKGDLYFWTDDPRVSFDFRAYFLMTYKVKKEIRIEVDEATGESVAVFQDAVPNSVTAVTASFKTDTTGGKVKYHFRPGTRDQEALPTDGIRNIQLLGDQLSQGAERTFTTRNQVHDVELGIESGPDGMYDFDGKEGYRSEHRVLEVALREVGAPDRDAPLPIAGSFDSGPRPSEGWVRLSNPADAAAMAGTIRVASDKVGNRGKTVWAFSVAALLAHVQGKGTSKDVRLPYAKYEIRITAIDKANVDDAGRATDNVKSELFWASATEIIKVPLVLPHHATLTLEEKLEPGDRESVYAVSTAGRRVWVPESTAAYSAATGRPEPGEFVWTRNPVWCACDWLTDRITSAGRFYTWKDNVHLASAIAAASFCDDLVRRPPA